MFSFRRYEAHRGDLVFQVVGVWTYATKAVKTSYRQAHEGIERYADWIRKRPTVILGDFNGNVAFEDKWSQFPALAASLGLVSAYHHYFGEAFGEETRHTHFHQGKETAPSHLDYCFLPHAWTHRVTRVKVGRHREWKTISDHVPLVVDLDL